MRSRSIATCLLLAMIFGSGHANAEPPFMGRCGRVNDFVAPTASAPGSITIGSLTFGLTANDRVPSQIIGMIVCTRRGTLTSGPILVVQQMTVPLCGRVELIYSPDGLVTLMFLQIVDIDPSYRVALQVTGVLPAFVAESIDRGVSGCFQFALDARGNVVITGLIGGGSAPPAQASATPRVRQLPSTSTTR
jgi:hypothetical protein